MSGKFIDGRELRSSIDHRRLSIDDILDIATQIASGLQAAHEKGVTHRDIKSSNIMITDKGQVKIMDFGLAKVRGGELLTKVGTTLGTAAYMSPEQARGEETDHRADIWSFGVVLYEMLTAQLPFKGDYEQAVIYSIGNEEPKPVRDLRDDVPATLQHLVTQALAKDPEARFETAGDLTVALRAIGKPSESSGSEVSLTRPGGQILFAKLRYAIAGALLLTLVVIAGMLLLRDRTGAIGTLAILAVFQ